MNNYQKQIEQINNLVGRPTLLLHVCCGVCSVYPLLYLRKYFDITIYFSNSNIYPYEEFLRRLDALQTYLKVLNDDSIKLIIGKYDYDAYDEKLKEHASDPEGGTRCRICYSLRMKETFKYAFENHYDYATTVMTISNHKNAEAINAIGEELEKMYPSVKYLHTDLKKNDGITMNEKLNKELNLYHQNYCGCKYSKR